MSTRTIDVTGGEVEYLTAEVTERYGASLETASFEVGLGTATAKPETWQAADTAAVSGATALVSMLIDGPGFIGAGQRLWVKVSDTPETYFLVCRNQAVDVV